MTDQEASYRQIVKATSLFGGVQVFNIFIAIIRSKFVAVLLGPAGMGIAGLLTATTGFIASLTNFGLGTSAVKNIAASFATKDNDKVAIVVAILRKLVWITGSLGSVVTMVLSPWLSQLTFGNKNYTTAFIWISITLLINQLSSGQSVVLQGLRKLNYLAKANMIGAIIGLVITVPVYYFWSIDGIVPVIILSSMATMSLTWYFSWKVGIKPVRVSIKDTFIEGKEMLKMGFLISLSGLMSYFTQYLVRIYISNTGGVEQVGLFNSGNTISTMYVGMAFTAMVTDYYPRLSAVAHDNLKARQLINQQATVAILILAPLVAFFLVFINMVVIVLYSYKFVAINEMIRWSSLSIYFKAASWAIAFIMLAKGASKIYFWNELTSNIYVLIFNIVGYRLAGLTGLGISFLVGYLIYFIQVFLVARIKYEFAFEKEFYQIAGLQLIIGLICFFVTKILTPPWLFIIGAAFIMTSTIFSFRELDKRIELLTLIKVQLSKLRKR